jgi:hypothetical protein
MFRGNDVPVTGGSDKDIGAWRGILHGGNFIATHGRLERVDRIDFSNQNAGAVGAQRLGALRGDCVSRETVSQSWCAYALANVSETGDDGDLAGQHNVGGSLDTVNEGFAAAVVVVELGLRDGIVHVDRRHLELSIAEHLVKMVNTGGGFLRQTLDVWVMSDS